MMKQTKPNFQKMLDDVIASLQGDEARCKKEGIAFKKPTLLLHACCGPCSSYVLEYLAEFFQITVFYYNPNIYPQEEYFRRLDELKALYTHFPPALENGVKIVEADYEPEEFYEAAGVRENPALAEEAEKGERCRRCYRLRLEHSYTYARAHNFDYFCTTLSISPFKDAEKINEEGAALAQAAPGAPAWLYSDFKKKGGFKRSLELSAEYNLYRQQYCGCIFSLRNGK